MDDINTATITEQQAQTPPLKGLPRAEAEARLSKYGPNEIAEKQQSTLKQLFSYFWGPIPWMIEAAAVLSGALGNWADLAIIILMLCINAAVAFWQEHKAGDAIALLKARLAPEARVLRDEHWSRIPARELVPGDVVLLQIGNIVPADAKLIKGDYLSVDESALTGESLPVDKGLGDQAYSGAIVRQGEMTALVTATGMNTYFGKTAQLVATAEVRSHFQRAVLKIGNFLILATAGLVALILLVALFRQEPFFEVLQFALILTVAAIPVALPTVLSVTMAIGAERLAQMKAIVSRLVAIEELAGVDVLCADKTGTLTKNKLTLGDPLPAEGIDAASLVLAAALASNRDGADAIDDAVLAGLKSQAALDNYEFVKFTPFDPVSKRTEATVRLGNKELRVSKGAAQVILDLSMPDADVRQAAEDQVEGLAQQGFRTIAVARAENGGGWRYLGLLPIFDPPRDDAQATIAETKRMGVEVKMITGDHEAIARQIAGRLGLGDNILSAHKLFDIGVGDVAGKIEAANGVARVFPEHKFQIVKTLEAGEHIIGMTGDGVNDAPALKQADVGIAVSGATDAARAAADLVLTAPGLSVITSAIEEARRIFERMTSYATYRIAETIRVLVFMTLSILIFRFYPVTAIMIVMLAILNDFPIMMIAYDNAPFADHPVRWDMRRVLTLASVLGIMGVVETFLLFWFIDTQLHLPKDVIQTIIFLKLLVAGHLTIYVTRSQRWFWSHPWPDIRLFLTCEATQILGTFIAVYGLAVTPIGWTYALGVWAYALVWLPIESAIALGVRRLLDVEARQGGPR